jgi:RNA polymerase sigma-70 factor (ECF subfamily)
MAMSPDSAFRRYSAYVAAIAHRLLGRDDDVDDAVQEVFVAAIRGMHAVRDEHALKAWLACVTVRVAHRKLRSRRMWRFLGLDDSPDYETVADGGASPEQRALLARVYEALDGVPTDARVAWTLRYVEGERLEAVAELCGCSLATAKRRIATAQQQLGKELGDA